MKTYCLTALLLSMTTGPAAAAITGETATPVECRNEHERQIDTTRIVLTEAVALSDAVIDSDPLTLQVFVVQNAPETTNRVSDNGQAVYIQAGAASKALAENIREDELFAVAMDRRVAIISQGACPVPVFPNPASRKGMASNFPKIAAKAVGVTLQRVSARWNAEDVIPLYASAINTKNIMDVPLANHADQLGKVTRCDEGELSDYGNPIPKSIKYSGVCNFEHGRAKVFVLFGLPKEGPDFWLFYFGVWPEPEKS